MTTGMRILLGNINRLARQAIQAAPTEYRHGGDTMARVWGLTILTGTWSLFIMMASSENVQQAVDDNDLTYYSRDLGWTTYVSLFDLNLQCHIFNDNHTRLAFCWPLEIYTHLTLCYD